MNPLPDISGKPIEIIGRTLRRLCQHESQRS